MTDQCRICQAEVIFVPSAKSGKAMILNAEPEKRIVIVDAAQPTPGTAPNYGPKVAYVMDTYVDHHATCPAAGQWKGRTR